MPKASNSTTVVTPPNLSIFGGMAGHLLRRAYQISHSIFTEEMSAFDVTPVQCAALEALRASPGIDATRLAQAIAVDTATVGPVIDRLERKALVVRGPRVGDRRIKELRITAAGEDILGQVRAKTDRVHEKVLAPLDRDQKAVFIKLLAQLVEGHASPAQ